MSEYIKREDAVERVAFEIMYEVAIAKRLSYKELFDLEKEKIDRVKLHVQKWLEQVSSADVVEVVRCKDCKHHEELLYNHDGKVLCWVHGIDVVVDRNGYCNYGEREEQEHEKASKEKA